MAQGLFLSTLSFIDHLMYRISLKDTTYFDFKRETWIQNNFKDYSVILECFRFQLPFDTGRNYKKQAVGT